MNEDMLIPASVSGEGLDNLLRFLPSRQFYHTMDGHRGAPKSAWPDLGDSCPIITAKTPWHPKTLKGMSTWMKQKESTKQIVSKS